MCKQFTVDFLRGVPLASAMYSSYGMSELAVAPLDASYPSAVSRRRQFKTEDGHSLCASTAIRSFYLQP